MAASHPPGTPTPRTPVFFPLSKEILKPFGHRGTKEPTKVLRGLCPLQREAIFGENRPLKRQMPSSFTTARTYDQLRLDDDLRPRRDYQSDRVGTRFELTGLRCGGGGDDGDGLGEMLGRIAADVEEDVTVTLSRNSPVVISHCRIYKLGGLFGTNRGSVWYKCGGLGPYFFPSLSAV